jgi:PAS domain S-box-containing protein
MAAKKNHTRRAKAPDQLRSAHQPTKADERPDEVLAPHDATPPENKLERFGPAVADISAFTGGLGQDAVVRSLAAVVESSAHAILSKDLDGTIRTWNRGAERLYGYSPDEAVGRSVQMLVPEDRAEEWSQAMSQLARGKHVEQLETERVRKDGRRIAVALTMSPIRAGNGKLVSASEIGHDIADRRRAEQALRESEERFRLMADAAPVLIWMSGIDKQCTWFNKPWLDFVGRPIEQELGNGWAENIHADDYDGCLKTYTTAFDARRPFSMEYRLKRHDGEYRWLLDNGLPLYGADAEFCGYIGSCIDITERRKAEESVAETCRHLNLAMSAGRMAAWTWDPHKDVVSTSENFREICGVSSIDGRRHGESLLHPEDLGRHSEIVDYAVKHGTPYQSVFRMIRPDNGQIVWLDLRAVPVIDSDGHLTTLSGVAIDISERKRGEQDLLASEQRMRAILDTAMDAIITMDIHGMIQSVNPATEQLFGYAAAEMVGHNVGLLMPSPYREEHDGYLTRYLQTGQKHIIGVGRELEARRKDGSIFPIHLVVSEIEDRKLFTGILRDMTEYKRLEREVLEVATLEQQRIGQELHDGVGQELAGLTMVADALAQQLKDLPPQAELAGKVVAGLQRLQKQSRALARGLVPVDVDPDGLHIALADLAARTREQSGVDCTFQSIGQPDIPDGITATHLLRIAQEAVLNALRHGRAKNIQIALQAQGNTLSLTIRDDGIGFPGRPNHGRGLGIRIMRNRAAVIGGTFIIAPVDGDGTLVSCMLTKGRRRA